MSKEELENMSLEEAFSKIEKLMENMSSDNVTLEESFSLYKDGMELLKVCSDKIDTVEKKVMMLNQEGVTVEF